MMRARACNTLLFKIPSFQSFYYVVGATNKSEIAYEKQQFEYVHATRPTKIWSVRGWEQNQKKFLAGRVRMRMWTLWSNNEIIQYLIYDLQLGKTFF